LSQTTNN